MVALFGTATVCDSITVCANKPLMTDKMVLCLSCSPSLSQQDTLIAQGSCLGAHAGSKGVSWPPPERRVRGLRVILDDGLVVTPGPTVSLASTELQQTDGGRGGVGGGGVAGSVTVNNKMNNNMMLSGGFKTTGSLYIGLSIVLPSLAPKALTAPTAGAAAAGGSGDESGDCNCGSIDVEALGSVLGGGVGMGLEEVERVVRDTCKMEIVLQSQRRSSADIAAALANSSSNFVSICLCLVFRISIMTRVMAIVGCALWAAPNM